jgi:hypothetical protein
MTRSTKAALVELERLNPSPASVQSAHPHPLGGEALMTILDAKDQQILGDILATSRNQVELPLDVDFKPHPFERKSTRVRKRIAVAAVVSAVIIAVVAVLVGSTPTNKHQPSVLGHPPSTVPTPARWQLADFLSGVQFQAATGTPNSIVGVTCSGAPTCFLSTGYGLDYNAGGGMYVSLDGGHSWRPSPLPASTAITTLASCASSSWCAAGAGTLDSATGDPAAKKPSRDPVLMVTTDAGATWTTNPIPLPVQIQQLPAYGDLPAETTYWPGEVDAVSCAAVGVCNVLGHAESNTSSSFSAGELVFLRTTDGGVHWTSTILPEQPSESSLQLVQAPGESETMSCPTANDCVVMGTLSPPGGSHVVVDAWRTTNAGKTWEENRVPSVVEFIPSLSCPDPDHCWAGPAEPTPGQGGGLLHSTDGGLTWSVVVLPYFPPTSPTSAGAASSVSCTSSSNCSLSLGSSGIAETTDGGTTWHQDALPTGVGTVLEVSCNPQQACVAIANPATTSPISLDPYNGGSLILTNTPSGLPKQS